MFCDIINIMKQYILTSVTTILLLFFNGTVSFASNPSDPEEEEGKAPKVGLVLSGGGAKGAAHIGVVKYLEEIGMPIDYITGTSMGSIIGGLYAMGYSAQEMDNLISGQNWSMIMSNKAHREDVSYDYKRDMETFLFTIPFSLFRNVEKGEHEDNITKTLNSALPIGIIRGQNVFNLLNGLSVGYQDSVNFDDLPIPYACVALDLLECKEVVFRSGYMPLAIRSSMAIPGVFSPVEMDGMLLVDGGVINNYPVDVAKDMGADIIIGSTVQSEIIKHEGEITSLWDIVNQLISYMGIDRFDNNLTLTDIHIQPDIEQFSTMSFDQASIAQLIENGYNAAYAKKDELLALKAKLDELGGVKKYSEAPKAKNIAADSIMISSIELIGIEERFGYNILDKTEVHSNDRVDGKDIEKAVSLLYGTGAFSEVTYLLKGDKEPYQLTISATPGAPHKLGVGFRFDSEETAAILLNVGLNSQRLGGHKLNLTGRLSYNSWFTGEYSYGFKKLPQFNLSYTFKSTDMNLYNYGKVAANLLYYYNAVEASLSGMNFKKFDVRLGPRYENFSFRHVLSDSEIEQDNTMNNFLSLFGKMSFDSRDNQNFPTKGNRVNLEANYYFANLLKEERRDFAAIQVEYTGVYRLSPTTVISPSIFARTVLLKENEKTPAAFINVMGGSEFGRYMNQQIPFIGINYAQGFENHLAVGRVDLRQQIVDNHYLSLIGNIAFDSSTFGDFFNGKVLWGAGVKYAYNSIIGPLSLNLHWSNVSKSLGAYINIGYYF